MPPLLYISTRRGLAHSTLSFRYSHAHIPYTPPLLQREVRMYVHPYNIVRRVRLHTVTHTPPLPEPPYLTHHFFFPARGLSVVTYTMQIKVAWRDTWIK